MENNKKVDDIVAMLDQFMGNGGGHMNVTNDSDNDEITKKINKGISLDCAGGNMACKVPTLHEGLDAEE